jgi:hypothetical protein
VDAGRLAAGRLVPDGVEQSPEGIERERMGHFCRPVKIEAPRRKNGKDWPFTGATMVGWDRLTQWEKGLYRCLDEEVPGDVVETGIWRGGALMLAAAIFKEQGVKDRKIWGHDSFEGLPPVNKEAFPADTAQYDISQYKALSVTQDLVHQLFENWNVPMDDVNLVKGWFKDTLKNPEVQQVAALWLDGDYYESTIQALEALEPRVSDNGIIVIDDYEAFPGCKQAVDEYRKKRSKPGGLCLDERCVLCPVQGQQTRRTEQPPPVG